MQEGQTANSQQVGGKHYKTKFEHWDLVPLTGMGYFDGQVTKYITRWKTKDGLQALEKSLHFFAKMKELIMHPDPTFVQSAWPPRVRSPVFDAILDKYREVNNLGENEFGVIKALAYGPSSTSHSSCKLLDAMTDLIQEVIDANKAPPVRSDSNKHAGGDSEV